MFDLSTLNGLTIISASLELYVASVGYDGSDVGTHYCLDNSWDEDTITGNTAPSFVTTASEIITILVDDSNQWISFDITSDVISSVSAGAITEVLRIQNLAGYNHDIRFWSSEYADSNYHPRLVIEYIQPTINADINIQPEKLRLKSKGKDISCLIELPTGYDVNNIDGSSVQLWHNDNSITSAKRKPMKIGDFDGDGVPDLKIKFNRNSLVNYLETNSITGSIELKVTCLVDGINFEGVDSILVF
jgi:hypothetical protein